MKKQIILYSLDKEKYPNTTIDVEIIDNTANQINQLVDGPVFKGIKKAVVQARKAKVGEIVDTRPRVEVDGKIYTFSETKRTITQQEEEKGAIIVINPDGEEYVINSAEKFNAKYQQMNGGYVAIDGAKDFVRSNGNYAIQTSWGEEQIVLKGSCFCVQDKEDIYGITNTAFDSTYETEPSKIEKISEKMSQIKMSREKGMAE